MGLTVTQQFLHTLVDTLSPYTSVRNGLHAEIEQLPGAQPRDQLDDPVPGPDAGEVDGGHI